MSMSPRNFISRFNDLKNWQKHHDSVFDKSKRNSEENVQIAPNISASHYESIESVTVLAKRPDNMVLTPVFIGEDTVLPSPPKTFQQILDEKLVEVKDPIETVSRPKKPYLKKGSGLRRYGLKPGRKLKFVNHKDSKGIMQAKSFVYADNNTHDVHVFDSSKLYTKTNNSFPKENVNLTPLKTPSLNVQMRAKWCTVESEPKKNVHFADAGDYYFNNSCTNNSPEDEKTFSECTENDIEYINTQGPSSCVLNDNNNRTTPYSEQSYYERQLEKELLLFEILEEKVQNSSFSSTSSSVIQLLASTPTKKKHYNVPDKIVEESIPLNTHQTDNEISNLSNSTLTADDLLYKIKKLLSNKLTSVVNISHLQNNEPIEPDCDVKQYFNNEEKPDILFKKVCKSNDLNSCENNEENTRFSDEEKWSSHSETTSLDSSSSDIGSNTVSVETQDAAVNTDQADNYNTKSNLHGACISCTGEINKRLIELNNEITAFRNDNSILQEEKKQIQEEKKVLQEERMQMEREMKRQKKELEDEKRVFLFDLEEERKKLVKEKMIFERYVKENQYRPNKREREEISNLKVEVSNLKETMKLKETKYGATQARLRTQIKQLEKENSLLKQETEKLTRENAKLVANQKVYARPSDTKIIHEINKNLSKIAKEAFKNHHDSEDVEDDELISLREKCKSMKKKLSRASENTIEIISDILEKSDQKRNSFETRKSNDSKVTQCDETSDVSSKLDDTSFKSVSHINVENCYRKVFGDIMESTERKQNNTVSEYENSASRESILEDGTKEIKFENGDIKTISPDGNNIVVKYKNGDVKHTNLIGGIIKYHFAHNKSVQTTCADGTEVLEFASGQVEKKYKDGTCEVQFPGGVRRIVTPHDTEEITYPDGTHVKIEANGDKIISLTNGQKETHTQTEKKREYPDGTVKILYNDGRQETRYSNGRIRIKDKDGNLILDTHRPKKS